MESFVESNDEEKSRLEIEKLDAEICELKRPWWKRPAWLGVVLPVALGIAALSVGYINGLFDVQSKLLENRRTLLQIDISNYRADSTKLRLKLDSLRDSISRLTILYGTALERLSAEAESARKAGDRADQLGDSLTKVLAEVNFSNVERDRLKQSRDSVIEESRMSKVKELAAWRGIRDIETGKPVIYGMLGSRFPTDYDSCKFEGANFGTSKGRILVVVSCQRQPTRVGIVDTRRFGLGGVYSSDTLTIEGESIGVWQDSVICVNLSVADKARIESLRAQKKSGICPRLVNSWVIETPAGLVSDRLQGN